MLSPLQDPRSAQAAWFVAMCKAGQEQRAKSELLQQRFESYLPMMQTERRYRGRWCARTEPLFPRYLFVFFNPFEQSTRKIRSTRGVISLLAFGGSLATVPSKIIDAMVKREDPITGLYDDRSAALSKGDQVELLEGPFKGMRALMQENSGKRVRLLLQVLNHVQHLTLPRNSVARVAA